MLTDSRVIRSVRQAHGRRLVLLLLHLVEVAALLVVASVLAEGAARHQSGDGRALIAVLIGLAICTVQSHHVLDAEPRLTQLGLAAQAALLIIAISALLWDPVLGVCGTAVTGATLVAWGRVGDRSPARAGSQDDRPDPGSAVDPAPIESGSSRGRARGFEGVAVAGITVLVIVAALAVHSSILLGLFVVAAVFVPIERWLPLHRRPILRRHWRTDVVHFVVNGSLLILGVVAAVIVFGTILRSFVPAGISATVGTSPVWAQVVVGFVVATVGGYAGHREAHEVPLLWRFHRVHHSIPEMDWLAASHLNPIDETFIRSCAVVPLFALGFGRASLGAYVVLLTFQAIFIHSNVRFTFGPVRWLIATPQYHHWHHAREPRAYNANYAGEFPVVDVLFGTCFLPTGHWPDSYGVSDRQPEGYLRQLVWPFRGPCRSPMTGSRSA